MCTLVVLNRVVPGLPVVLAANRDEFFGRPATGPIVLDPETGVVGGRDLVAGGTWMGVGPGGFFAGITNQRIYGERDPTLRSRGEIVLEVLRAGESRGTDAARAWLESIDAAAYSPFNLIFGTADALWVAYGRRDLKIEPVPVGVHILPNDVLDSAEFPKVERIAHRLGGVEGRGLPRAWPALVERLVEVMGDDTPPETLPAEPLSSLPLAARAASRAARASRPSSISVTGPSAAA